MAYRTSDSDAGQYPSAGKAWYVTCCLLLCYLMFFIDRNILTLLVSPVRKDLGITDTEMGLLQGFAFSLFYGVMGVPFGWLADRVSRRNIIIFGVGLWGLMTIASGFATTFSQLVVTRMGLGLGEAALMPATFSLLADYFPKDRRGRAVGLFGTGGFAGIGIAYIIGGAVLAAFRGVDVVTLPLVGETSLWHAAFIVVGCATVLLAILMTTIREVPRKTIAGAPLASEPQEKFFSFAKRHWVSLGVVYSAYICVGIVAIGWFAWLPSYFIRNFKMAPVSAGFQIGLVTTISGVLGCIAGGYIADWLSSRRTRGGRLSILLILFLGWVPAALGIWLFDNPTLSLACVFLFTFTDGVGLIQYGNVTQEIVPAHLRAQAIAGWIVAMSFIGYGTGPVLFAWAADHLFEGPAALRYSLGILALPVIAVGLAITWWGRRPYDRARLEVDPTANVDVDFLASPAIDPMHAVASER
jgi:MFS family permease